MPSKSKANESLFLVSLQGLNLSADQKKRVEESIRAAALKEIAGFDNSGDVKISKRFKDHPNWKDLWDKGHLAGFWLEGLPDIVGGGPINR